MKYIVMLLCLTPLLASCHVESDFYDRPLPGVRVEDNRNVHYHGENGTHRHNRETVVANPARLRFHFNPFKHKHKHKHHRATPKAAVRPAAPGNVHTHQKRSGAHVDVKKNLHGHD